MAGETTLTIVGNLTADPELRYTQQSVAVANFTIASTPRTFDRNSNEWVDGEALFMRCSAWKELGEHASGSLHKGDRVIVQGRLKQRSYDKDGQSHTVIELEVDEVAPSLRYANAVVTRISTGNRNQQQRQGQVQQQRAGGQQRPPQQQPVHEQQAWAQPGAYDDEIPF